MTDRDNRRLFLVGSGSGFARSSIGTAVGTNAAGRGEVLRKLLLLRLRSSGKNTSVHAITIAGCVVVNAIIYTYATVRHCRVAISHFTADALVAGTAQPHRLEQFLVGQRGPVLGTVGAEDLAARATVVLPTAQPKFNLAGGAPRYRVVRYPQYAARDLLR